ncbi:MAG TPA: PspC domain-containing protein [Clostridiaceae bacterium]|jgi:phage shock protein C|nr:PspC domain-containing protein [Clostridiaceae bacterium]HBG39354.1 PspC domain-containing protein [Clostridiaceae bacterium]HBN29285.1 PspC domain-containing protein [Clostridiaceae bacterium]HBX49423.1 PspC domain-containing protein [Clostridiaceae bacterium]HCL50658.1 PspC domain-containing protein [Clostridiaceae bacterium]
MNKKLYLSDTDKKLAGVCGGIAEFFEIDSTIIRLLWIAFSLVYGSGIIAYIIFALVMPHKPNY